MALDSKSLTSRMMVGNLDIPLIMVMRPNPISFTKSSRKRNSEVLTNSGWVDVHWGNERDTIQVSGLTASKIGNPEQYKDSDYFGASASSIGNSFVSNSGTSAHGPKQWADIERFIMKLEQIYKLDKERIGSIIDLVSGNNITGKAIKLQNPFEKNKNRDTLLTQIQNGTAKRAQSFIIYNYVMYWGYFTNFNYKESATDKPKQYAYDFGFKVVNSTTDWLSQSLINNFPEARALGFFNQIADISTYAASMLTSADKLAKGIFL